MKIRESIMKAAARIPFISFLIAKGKMMIPAINMHRGLEIQEGGLSNNSERKPFKDAADI